MLLLTVFILFFLALAASIYGHFFILYPLLLGLAGMAFVACRRAYSLRAVLAMAYTGAMQTLIVIKVLLHVGALTAMWRASGVIYFLVYHGLQVLSPRYFLEGAFLLSAAFSFLLGSSLGTVSVLGIALIVIASGGGLSIPMTAGAIIAGAFLGDRGSPMSSSAWLVASITHTPLYSNIANMLRTSWIPLLLSMTGYALLARTHGLEHFDPAFVQAMDTAFIRHPLMLVPPLIVLAGCALRIRFSYVMPMSTISAMALCIFVQHQSVAEIIHTLFLGYQPAERTSVTLLFAGGGWISVVPAMCIIFCSSAFAGIFAGAHLLADVEKVVARLHARCGAYLTNMLVSATTAALACNQTLAIILTNQLQFTLHNHSPASRSRFALMLENSVVMLSALVPWNIAVALPLAILDAGPSSIVYAFYVWLIPLLGWFIPAGERAKKHTI